MVTNNRVRRLTRAQAEGVLYELPDTEEGKIFAGRVEPFRDEPGALLEILHLAQECFGYLSKPVLGWIAQEFRIPRSDVYTAATFYSMFNLKPEAKYTISVCTCLSCYLLGGEAVLAAILKAAGIPSGKTESQDGLFSIHEVSCLGLCDQSPVIMVNRERHGLLTPKKAEQIIADLRDKEYALKG